MHWLKTITSVLQMSILRIHTPKCDRLYDDTDEEGNGGIMGPYGKRTDKYINYRMLISKLQC